MNINAQDKVKNISDRKMFNNISTTYESAFGKFILPFFIVGSNYLKLSIPLVPTEVGLA